MATAAGMDGGVIHISPLDFVSPYACCHLHREAFQSDAEADASREMWVTAPAVPAAWNHR